MSMLAQGRRKQKISTNPNGLHFFNDESNIGQKLLSQMGWEKGKGLGANGQGDKDPVKVKMNMENRGLGCKRSDVDKWIAHQDDFNSLLANLNENTEVEAEADEAVEQSGASQSNEGKPTVQSLEAKSKSSRSRVHYMKFTKGKDLSRHSQKDLTCILGPSRSGNCTPTPQAKSSSAVNSDNESNPDSADPFLSDAIHVTSTLSLQEYFASKMAAKKNSSSNLLAEMAVSTDAETGDETMAEDIVKPSFFIGDTAVHDDEEEEATKIHHKRKKPKDRPKMENSPEADHVESHKKKKKKSKKEKRKEERHASGGKTKPKPADHTMKFVSESSEEEDTSDMVEQSKAAKKDSGRKRKNSGGETTADYTSAGKIKKSKSDSQLEVHGSSSKATHDSDAKAMKKKHKKKCKDNS